MRRLALTGLAAVLLAVGETALLAKEGAIQCANLIYGGTHTSRCFSDEFLSAVQRETTVATERRFKAVKLASDELFRYPFVVLTGEEDFHFTQPERVNLKKYLTSGGFLLASAGCSSRAWDQAFRREMQALFADAPLKKVALEHPLFRTVYKIEKLTLTHGGTEPVLEGLELNGKFVVIYSPHGLNDTAHTEGCCCCGGNEIANSMQVNVNVFVYALLH